jgi:hypothetical protein
VPGPVAFSIGCIASSPASSFDWFAVITRMYSGSIGSAGSSGVIRSSGLLLLIS